MLLSVARFCSISCDDAPLQGAAQAAAGDVCSLTEPSSVRLRACDHARAGRIFCGRSSPADRPAQLLIIVAFGLLTGQRLPPLDLKPLFIFFAPILAFALTLTATGVIRGVYQPILTGIALCAAIPVALQEPVSPLIYRVLTTAVALAIGFDSAPEPSSTGVLIKALAGTGIIVIFLVFDLAYYTRLAMGRPWLRVGVRVLGSWIIAISFLVLALSLLSSPTEMASQKR